VWLLLLFNTTRTSPDPQAREPLSLWTEVWPTQPVLLLLFNTTRKRSGHARVKIFRVDLALFPFSLTLGMGAY